jgi:hypothetical protein
VHPFIGWRRLRGGRREDYRAARQTIIFGATSLPWTVCSNLAVCSKIRIVFSTLLELGQHVFGHVVKIALREFPARHDGVEPMPVVIDP